jgi:DNA modification methylase
MLELNTIHRLDCIEAMQQLDEGCVDLVFADPPFNIGYKYDVYKDRKAPKEYLDWSRQWISGVHRALKPTGTFWLAIGDDYAAELKILSQDIGFYCRSWVLWYYTFGVNCKLKFSRSHTHIFHFVKDRKKFTFNGAAIAVPSARQTVYADTRAAKDGRLPDDTWILRPQDLVEGLNPDEDTWYFPRVAGTFKEREGFHGCQMPEQLLGRIIKVSSNPGELVLDPFSGSATTVSVAKKLGRQFLSFDISDEYITRGFDRLSKIEAGDALDGAPEPKVSAPSTPPKGTKKGTLSAPSVSNAELTQNYDSQVIEAYRQTSSGFSTDRVLVDPGLNSSFLESCQKLGVNLPPVFLNRYLLRLRKAGKLSDAKTTERTSFKWDEADSYLFASEIAWRTVFDQTGASLDDIFCNPALSKLFDETARKFAPGFSSLEYRWGALTLRKAAKDVSARSQLLEDPDAKLRFIESNSFEELDQQAGLYVVSSPDKKPLYVGEALNLGIVLRRQFQTYTEGWKEFGKNLTVKAVTYQRLPVLDISSRGVALSHWLMAYQCLMVQKSRPKLNLLGIKETTA